MRVSLALVSALALLAAGPAAGEPARNSSAAAPGDKMICKRFTRIGSLVDSYKTCKTKKEWDREHENLQQLRVTDSCRDRANGGTLCAQ
jgi:hypothetical protein